jgi:hypothetical protein
MLEMSVTAGEAPGRAEITLYKVFDSAGRLLEDGQIGLSREAGSGLSLVGLSLEDSFIMAFKVEPTRAVVRFDLRIDGEPAIRKTYVGENMVNPDQMPFEMRDGRHGRKAQGKPSSYPGTPYFLVWHEGQDNQGRRPAKPDKDVRQELRSLGYIQ